MASLLKGVGFITGAAAGEKEPSTSPSPFLPILHSSILYQQNPHPNSILPTSGIGKATASAFAIHGARALALADINPSTLHSTTTGLQSAFPHIDFLPLTLDTSSEESVQKAVRNTVNTFGRLDYAVNNAGIAGQAWKTAQAEVSQWRRTVDVNLSGVWLCGREELGVMLGQEVLEAE